MQATAATTVAIALAATAASVVGGFVTADAPDGVRVLAPGFSVERISIEDALGNARVLDHPTSLAFRGDELLIVEGGRYHFASPFETNLADGRVVSVSLAGPMGTATTLASGLDDPIGLAVASDGTIHFTQYTRVSRLVSGTGGLVVQDLTTGLPPQVNDFAYAPVTDTEVLTPILESVGQGDLIDLRTTGTMGLAFAPDGTLFATQGINQRPPDDVRIVSDDLGRPYQTPLSSAILRPVQGIADDAMLFAEGCRNCYDLVVTPAGTVYASENMGFYRLRAQAGEDRTAVDGKTSLADANHMDDIVLVEPGSIRRVATIAPFSATLGAAPTGLALAPASFPAGFDSRLFVVVFSGMQQGLGDPATHDLRGYVAAVQPEPATGLGPVVPFVVGLDFPIDAVFGPDGAMFVVEYFSGNLYRVTPEP